MERSPIMDAAAYAGPGAVVSSDVATMGPGSAGAMSEPSMEQALAAWGWSTIRAGREKLAQGTSDLQADSPSETQRSRSPASAGRARTRLATIIRLRSWSVRAHPPRIPNVAEFYSYAPATSIALDRMDEAVAAHRRAVGLAGDSAQAYYNLPASPYTSQAARLDEADCCVSSSE